MFDVEIGDVFYKSVFSSGESSRDMPTVRVVYIFLNKNLNQYQITLIDVQGKKRVEMYDWFKKIYITYEQMCDAQIQRNRDGYPCKREFEIVIRKDELENPEEYI